MEAYQEPTGNDRRLIGRELYIECLIELKSD